jgi:transposase
VTFNPIPKTVAAQAGVDFLSLSQWQTVAVKETAFAYRVEALPLSEHSACPKCGGPAAALRPRGTRRQALRDAPVRGKHVVIHFARRLYRCGVCGRTSSQPLASVEVKRKATTRLVEFLGAESFSKTYSQISLETGANTAMIRAVFAEKALEFENTVRPEAPRVLGVDEAYIRGQARYVLTDLEVRSPLEILHDRGMLTLCRYLLQVLRRERVEAVVIGLRRVDFEVVRRVIPQAAIVVNKWEVCRHAQRTLTKVLQNARAASPAEGRDGLMRAIPCLNKSHAKLTCDERRSLAEVFQRHPELEKAYYLRRGFFALWNYKSREEVEDRYDQWAAGIPTNLYYAFGDFLSMVEHWRREIFNYFDHPNTNAFTESVVQRLKLLQKVSPTYSFEAIRARVLYERMAKRPRCTPLSGTNNSLKTKGVWLRLRAARARSQDASSAREKGLRRPRKLKGDFNKLSRWHDERLE